MRIWVVVALYSFTIALLLIIYEQVFAPLNLKKKFAHGFLIRQRGTILYDAAKIIPRADWVYVFPS